MKICSGNHRLRTTSLMPWSKLFPQNFTFVETFNRFLAVYVMRYPRPEFQETQHSNLCWTLPYHTLLTSVSYYLQIELKRGLFPSRFQTKRLHEFLNFQMPGHVGPELSTTVGDFRLSDAVPCTSPRGCKAQRHIVTSTCILSSIKLNAFHAVFMVRSRKIPVTCVRIDEGFWGFLYVCFADPRKLLL